MKKQLLSIMLVFTILATLVATALPVLAEESEEFPFTVEFTSEITVSELNTTERVTNAGDIYLAYDWVTRGECDVFINWPDEGYDGKDPWSGSPIRLYERFGFRYGYEFEFIDNQETEPWEAGNTYDAQIKIYSMENPNVCKVIDVRVTVEALNIESISVEDYIWAPYTPKSPVITVTYKDDTTSNSTSGLNIRYDDEWPTEPGTYELKMSALNGEINFTIKLTVLEIVSVTAKPLTYSELENGDIEFTATYENGFTYTWLDEDTPLPSEVGEYTIEVSVFNDTFTVPVSITVTPTPTTGVWAEGFTWDYDKLTKTLYIKGEGMLPAPTNYGYKGLPIRNIVIEDGIEGFEQWALMQLSGGEYESLIFSSTIKSFPALGIFDSYTTVNNVIFREGITNITHLPFGIPGYGATVENIYVPTSVELIDVYSLIASAGGCGSSVVNLYYAGTEEQWTTIAAQPTLYFALRNLYNTDGSLELFELEGYSFPANYVNYVNVLRDYEMIGVYFYEYESKYEVTVRWVDEDGKVIDSENVVIGGNVTKNPDVPAKEGHTGKWSTAGTDITAPIVITPVYTANTYTVTWVDENGNTVDTEVVEYGKDATKNPAVPAKDGYTGKWSAQATEVKADVTIKVEYSANTFTVTWVDEDGNTVDTETVEYGNNATKNPAVPVKEGFSGKWSSDATNVTTDITIKPEYTVNTFTVTWIDENGDVIDTEIVEYGKDATKNPAVPVKEGFTGKWNATAIDVKTNITIEPKYTENIVVENGTATIPDSIIDVIEGEDIVIDVTAPTIGGNDGNDDNQGSEDSQPTQPPKVESVVIGSTTVDKITNANTNVEIKLPDATVSFDKEAIGSIGEQAGDKDVTIVAKEVEKDDLTDEQKVALEEKEVHAVLNLEAYAGENKLTEFGGGKVTISVPFEIPEGKEGSEFLVAYIADDGTMTVMPTSYANGALTFETTHFSSYVVLEVENTGAPDTGDSTTIALFVMLMAVCGIGLTACVAKRKAF